MLQDRPEPMPSRYELPFNRPYVTGDELSYIQVAINNAHLSGSGPFTERCSRFMEEALGAASVLLTHSCTGALELAALLADLEPGDEVIMPSFTFSTTATAFALRGAVPVFVDIRDDTLNLDERLVEAAITTRTRAIVAVHYAGVGCDMAAITAIARKHDLLVIEDAAQGFAASRDGTSLGTSGQLGALSFHETKNIISGEGGALIVNDPALVSRAEILLDKGTNRREFFRGHVDKYTWVDLGSSFVASELAAAFLWAQLEHSTWITERRLELWAWYHAAFADLERAGRLRRPLVPAGASHNAHLYYVLLPTPAERDRLLRELNDGGINAVFHYVPLHSAPAGRRYGRVTGDLPVTDRASTTLLRLPLWVGMDSRQVARVVDAVASVLGPGVS